MPDGMEMLGEVAQSESPWEAADDLSMILLACRSPLGWMLGLLSLFLCIIGKDLSY